MVKCGKFCALCGSGPTPKCGERENYSTTSNEKLRPTFQAVNGLSYNVEIRVT